jgi:hypothetical protein
MRIDVTGGVAIEGLVPEGRYEGSLAQSAWEPGISTIPSRSALKAPPTARPRGAIRKSHIATIPARIPTEKPSRGRGRRRVRERCASRVASDFGHATGITREQPKDAPRPPLSGRICATDNPGLKPWAIMYSRLRVKVRQSPPGGTRFLLYPRHFVPGYLHKVPPGQNRSSLQGSTNLSRTRPITK